MCRTLEALTLSLTACLSLMVPALILISAGPLTPQAAFGTEGPILSAIVKDGDWSVTGTETYRDGTISLNGNLTVSGTLVLDNTTLTIVTSTQGPRWVQVRGGGSLRLSNGSIMNGLSHGRYDFKAEASSSVHVNGSQVMDCGTDPSIPSLRGLYSRTNDLLFNGSVVAKGLTGIVVDGGSVKVRSSKVMNMDQNGIEVLNGGHAEIEGSSVTFCASSALSVHTSSANITNTILRDCQSALRANASTVRIVRTSFSARGMRAIESVSSQLYLDDCTPSLPGSDRLFLDRPTSGPSRAQLVNTTLMQLDVLDPKGSITEAYRKDFVVLTNGGKRADQAEVEVRDRDLRLEFHGITPPSGELLDVKVASHITNSTGRYPMDMHQLWVRLEGARRTMMFDSTTNHVFNLTVLLSEPDVTIDEPLNGTHLALRELTVKGRVADRRPISILSYILDGGDEVVLPAQAAFSIPLSLRDGRHEILVIAMNDDGRFGTASVVFFTDTMAPVIELVNPINNSAFNTSTVLFAGSCEPEVRLSLDGDLVPHPQSTFRYYKKLKEGLNIIKMEAWDLAGNGITRKVHVISDTTPPFIAVMTPTDGYRTRETSVAISGTTSPDTVGLTVNGQNAQLSEGRFEAVTPTLTEGPNQVTLSAVDRVGWRTDKDLTIWVDTTPPDIAITTLPRFTNKRDLTVQGMVDEGSEVTVNGMLIEVKDGRFNTVVELYQGANTILVRAVDDVGNMAERTVQVVLDLEAPVIERVQPPSGSTVKGKYLEVTGQAFDENGISSVSGRRSGGAFEGVNGLEEWRWVVELASGVNHLEVRAEDRAGNVRTMPLRYTLEASGTSDRTPPVIAIIEPKMNSTFVPGTVWVKGTADDDVGVASVQLRVNEGEWLEVEGRFRWSLNVTLSPGLKIIQARAFDASGNMGTDTVKVLVTVPDKGKQGREGEGPRPWMYAVLFTILLLFGGMAVYLMLRRKALMDEVRPKEGGREARSVRSGWPSRPGSGVGPSGHMDRGRQVQGPRGRSTGRSPDDAPVRPRMPR